ncbi:type II toxin-antitoxin system ParD family antitoxin [Sulfitobacter pontiacus]|jgi:antitoxin ParD1/3/4|uniref:type II toxin-antitoxin system ParD family antitoxin n=1 Tax=Sulfitobacter pontiacus TaxID=60137 RepID=UPI0016164C43|nr:type II toxin-antitoxin system ParD family antitoxin [Sulfitobacter pontiacus]GLO80264.1 antitoxin ParD4 [Sulfitobacter pontiacus]
MATMNVSLPEQMKSWVEQQSEGGRFANSSDYVRDLIRRDQERGVVIAELQAAIDDGLSSGPTAPFDPVAFKQKMHETRGQ